MKTLILNGSPKKNGDTTALIDELSRHLKGEIKVISSVFDRISPCVDCRYCWSHPGCAIADDMPYDYLEACDNIVIASPVWFSELSGPLLYLASRIQTYCAAKYFRKEPIRIEHKNGLLLLVGAEPGTEEKAIATAQTIFKHMNALSCVPSVFSMNTNNVPAMKDAAALAEIRNAAARLNQLYHDRLQNNSARYDGT